MTKRKHLKVKQSKKYPLHYYATPGEWIPHKAKMEWQCCYCGLVHNVYFRIGKLGRLEIKMTRNNKETIKNRKVNKYVSRSNGTNAKI